MFHKWKNHIHVRRWRANTWTWRKPFPTYGSQAKVALSKETNFLAQFTKTFVLLLADEKSAVSPSGVVSSTGYHCFVASQAQWRKLLRWNCENFRPEWEALTALCENYNESSRESSGKKKTFATKYRGFTRYILISNDNDEIRMKISTT